MAQATMTAYSKRQILRDKPRGSILVAVRLRRAARKGDFPDLELGEYYKIADACCEAAIDASDGDLDKFIAFASGKLAAKERPIVQQMIEDAMEAKLGDVGGSLLDLITMLLPILLPLIAGCFA